MRKLGYGVFCSWVLLTGPALHAQEGLVQVRPLLIHGRYAEAARKLQRIAFQGSVPPRKLDPVDERMLRRAIDSARAILQKGHPLAERNAARQVLCLSRAYFPGEELPGLEEALRVGGGVQRPELIGKPNRPLYPAVARKVGLQGVVIVEVVIDPEGCVRQSKVLKGLPFGLDQVAVTAVRSWTFQPATLEGRPRAVYYVLTVPFSLKDR